MKMVNKKKSKSIREAMGEVGKVADTKFDEISKSVKKHDKEIADIKKMVKEIKTSLSKLNPPASKKTAIKKSAIAKKTPAVKPRKKTGRKNKISLFPYGSK
jgi:hypothetical protein